MEPTRSENLAQVRHALQKRFPRAELTTNDDANPATPMIVKASWSGGRIHKVARADSINTPVDVFVQKAGDLFERFQANAIPSRDQ